MLIIRIFLNSSKRIMVEMKGIRRKEKAIEDQNEMKDIIKEANHITIAMCKNNVPYLVTLSHGYDPDQNCIFFHCAQEGKKIDYLSENNVVWGQALIDKGYVQGDCDHLYITTQFKGKVSFIEDFEEKKAALQNLIKRLGELKLQFTFDEKLVNHISKVGFDDVYGARPIKRAIQDEVEDLISELVLNGDVVENKNFFKYQVTKAKKFVRKLQAFSEIHRFEQYPGLQAHHIFQPNHIFPLNWLYSHP